MILENLTILCRKSNSAGIRGLETERSLLYIDMEDMESDRLSSRAGRMPTLQECPAIDSELLYTITLGANQVCFNSTSNRRSIRANIGQKSLDGCRVDGARSR
ncbi:MAG: hypothetical protein KME17_19500 [Cyanosarcina radialis HA8281-LM2]|nr:hypothetical protein [Cyanosarcina radialis HA8281-LM2]